MLIIIDGPDCSRKSTLTRLIADRLMNRDGPASVDVIHRGPPTSHPLDEYVIPLLAYRPGRGHHIVCDRWHLGELVYPGVVGRSTQLDDAVFRYVELFLQSRGAVLVVITPDENELRDCLTRRGDDPTELTRVSAIREGFLDAAARSALPLHWFKDETINESLIYDIIESGDSHARCVTDLALYTTYVGPRWPTLLLAGDVRATGTAGGDLRPAFMPYPATSGHYLMRALGSNAPFGVSLINACDVDDVRQARRTLNLPPVVALGRNAQKMFSSRDQHVVHAPHPQWHRRFRYHHLVEYHDLLLNHQESQ